MIGRTAVMSGKGVRGSCSPEERTSAMDQDLESFRTSVEHVVEHHPVVMDNTYTKWFAKGEATRGEVRHLAVQFSVDRKSTRLNSSHANISYAVFCLKKKKKKTQT